MKQSNYKLVGSLGDMSVAGAKKYLLNHCSRATMRPIARKLGVTVARLKEDLATNIARSPQRGQVKISTSLSV